MTGDQWVITEPGIYDGMTAGVYHADPVPGGSLSSSGARRLLPPSCPALFRYGPDKQTKAMDRGTAAHTQVLGAGPPLCVIEADDWRKQATKDAAQAARDAGQVPVLAAQAAEIKAMAAALEQHKTARQLFEPGSGLAEQSIFWADPDTGIWRRARPDWLPHGAGGLVILPDYKTAVSAHPDAVAKAMASYGYDKQFAWYADAVRWLRPGAEVACMLVVQETSPPYLVGCYQLDGRDLDAAARQNRVALEIYRDCTATGVWPGYDPYEGFQTIRVPRWARSYDDEW